MSAPRTRVAGPVVLPDGSPAVDHAEIVFKLKSWDRVSTSSGKAVAMSGTEIAKIEDGAISIDLLRNSAGDRGSLYEVSYRYWSGADGGMVSQGLGQISVTGAGPLNFADLLALPAPVPNVPDALAQAIGAATSAGVDAGIASDARDEAFASEARAALFGPRTVKDAAAFHGLSEVEPSVRYGSQDGSSVWDTYPAGTTGADFEIGGVGVIVATMALGINVRDFGAKGDGITDDTTAFRRAWTASRRRSTMVPGALGGGYTGIYAPPGFYRVTDNISPGGNNIGVTLLGNGPRSTTIWLDATSKTLMEWQTYVNVLVQGISFYTGTVTFTGGRPQIAVPAVKTNTCASFNSTGSGTKFAWRNCDFFGFRADFSSKISIVNGDNHLHDNCTFYHSGVVWENSNPQAVCWWFNQCKFFFTSDAVFDDPAGDLTVWGGDVIIPGTWLRAAATNLGQDCLFQAVRFEKYQNIDPSSAPKLLDIGVPGAHTNIVFDHCTNRGGGSLAGKTTAAIGGMFGITMRDCAGFEGNWDVTPSSSSSGQTGKIEFERCTPGINVVQTLVPGQGRMPANLIIKDQVGGSGRSRRFVGNLNGHIGISSGGVMTDAVRMQTALNNTTVGREVSILCPAPYRMIVAGADIAITNNTAVAVTVNIYADSTKAKKIGSITSAASSSGVWQALAIKASDLLAQHSITSTSSPLYVELEAAGNAGTVTANIVLSYLQAN